MNRRVIRAIKGIFERAGYCIERKQVHRFDIDLLDLLVNQLVSQVKDVFFVQIGANDGQMDDPINRYINRYHWRGILVEPVPHLFEALRRTYYGEPQLHLENVAIAATAGPLTLYALRPRPGLPLWASGVVSSNRKHLLKFSSRIPDIESLIYSIEVPTTTVDELLLKHHVEQVHILVIDTEGYDFEVLKTVDLTKTRPRIVQLEHGHMSFERQRECFDYLASFGYSVATIDINAIACLTPLSAD